MTTVHLQSIGKCSAIPANEVKVGDTLIWNFGITSKVIKVEAKGKSVYITEINNDDGKEYTYRKNGKTLLGIRRSNR